MSTEVEVTAVPAAAAATPCDVGAGDAKGADTLCASTEGVQQGFTRLPRTHA